MEKDAVILSQTELEIIDVSEDVALVETPTPPFRESGHGVPGLYPQESRWDVSIEGNRVCVLTEDVLSLSPEDAVRFATEVLQEALACNPLYYRIPHAD
jgi:hypothetical protein